MDFPVGNRTARDHFRGWLAVLAATAAAIMVLLAVAATAAAANGADSWGDNEFGQLCNGKNTGIQTLPGPASGLSEVKQVAAGGEFGLYLMNDGTVKACGFNPVGQLGDATTISSTTPVEVKGLTKVKAIAAGAAFGLALLEGGKVMAWGENEFGQLGNGAKGEAVHSIEPVEVKFPAGSEEVTAISAGGLSSYALLKNGTVDAWGFNEFGQLGNNSTTSVAEPVAVSGLTGVKAISGGFEFGLALLTSGEVKAWGNEEFGQLGNGVSGEKKQSNVPVPVSGLTKVAAISAGLEHSLALIEGGNEVKAWGDNDMGQVGNGTFTSIIATPVAVKELSGVKSVAAGEVHSLALLTNGTVKAWGDNQLGELGIGTSGPGTNKDEPVPTVELGEVTGISGGALWSLSMGAPDPTVTKVEPKTGPEAGGTTVTITGTNLTSATAVKFGTEKAKEFKVNPETTEKPATITAVSSAGSGSVDVTVNTPASRSPTSAADQFNYRLASMKPSEWKSNGGKISAHVQTGSWGSLKYENSAPLVGKLTCTAIMGGGVYNEGSATEMTGFETVEGFNTSGCSREPACPGAFVSAEPPVTGAMETKGTEKVLVARRPQTTLPWKGEVIEGLNAEKSIALKVKLSPVQMNLVEPCEKFEIPMEGTLEPILVNGTKNGLKPSHLTFEGKGGTTGHLINPAGITQTEREVFVSGEMKILGTAGQQLITAE